MRVLKPDSTRAAEDAQSLLLFKTIRERISLWYGMDDVLFIFDWAAEILGWGILKDAQLGDLRNTDLMSLFTHSGIAIYLWVTGRQLLLQNFAIYMAVTQFLGLFSFSNEK